MQSNLDSPTKGGLLELFASVETVSKFKQSTVIFSNRYDQVTSRVELSQRELVMVLVVEDVEEGREERVEVLQAGEKRAQIVSSLLLRMTSFS